MAPENVESSEVPFFFIPNTCTSLETNTQCNLQNYLMNLNLSITTPGPDGEPLSIYSGPCCVQRVIDIQLSYPDDIPKVEQEITADSSLNCDDSNKMPVTSSDVPTSTTTTNNQPQNDPEQVGYKRMRETPKQRLSPDIFNTDEDSESEMLSQLSKKKKNSEGDNIGSMKVDNEGDIVLKQSSLNSETGQTIQDPKVKCSAVTMDNDPPTNGGIGHQRE